MGDGAEVVTVPASGRVRLDSGGAFEMRIAGAGEPVEPVEPVEVMVTAPDGMTVHREELTLEQAGRPRSLRSPPSLGSRFPRVRIPRSARDSGCPAR